jgi:hypothetical protein
MDYPGGIIRRKPPAFVVLPVLAFASPSSHTTVEASAIQRRNAMRFLVRERRFLVVSLASSHLDSSPVFRLLFANIRMLKTSPTRA